MRAITGIGEIAHRYKAILLDLWGVVHDGVTLYPGVTDCLGKLHEARVRIAMFSNAPRRAGAARESLRLIGLADDLYETVITSGEVTRGLLSRPADLQSSGWGDRVWHLGPPRDRNLFEGLGLAEVPLGDAEFILNTGPDDERDPTDVAAFDVELTEGIVRGLPMLCANPDLEVIRGGRRIICAGALAERYQAMGGEVTLVGKPGALIYQAALAKIGLPKDEVLAVGDSLRTDVAGAAAFGIDNVWVLAGIHGLSSSRDVASIATEAKVEPTFVVDRFNW